jgi:hypothetical protein
LNVQAKQQALLVFACAVTHTAHSVLDGALNVAPEVMAAQIGGVLLGVSREFGQDRAGWRELVARTVD